MMSDSEDLNHHTIMWGEMKPDVYSGENMDQHRARWHTHCDGDMDSEYSDATLALDPKLFPPGTKISVEVPRCPQCDLPSEFVSEQTRLCDCGFDWKTWTEDQYS